MVYAKNELKITQPNQSENEYIFTKYRMLYYTFCVHPKEVGRQ